MEFKERMVHWLEEASERLRLGYQTTLHAIQTLNVLDHPRHAPLLARLTRTLPRANALAAALLALANALYHANPIPMRELVRAVGESGESGDAVCAAIRECECAVAVALRWKLAVPLLYDEAMGVAAAWEAYAAALAEFPVRFAGAGSDNHNCLVRNVRVCLYNFSHLTRSTPLDALSPRVRRLALAIFLATLKQLLRDQAHAHVLSPHLSIAYLQADFLRRSYGVQAEELAGEVGQVTEVLNSYRQFREQSKRRGKLTAHHSNKHSEDKENAPYFVNRQKPTKPKSTLKSRSRSKADRGEKEKEKEKEKEREREKEREKERERSRLDVRGKLTCSKWESRDQLKCREGKTAHKKSSSAKSIHPCESQQLPKRTKFSKSKASRRSDKSQLASKLTQLEDHFTSKSTYWLKPLRPDKPDKKSAASIRMKLR